MSRMEKMSADDIIKKQQEILGKLSPEERKMALDILGEYSKIGESEVLKELLDSDYAETPADISTFLHDKKYLGNALYDQEGRFTLFPYWEEKLKEVFPDRFTTAYNTIVLTGAIGLGKSTVAVICLLYMLHRLLCLKDPYLYYGLQPIDKISISLMNITLENAKGVALDKMNQMILSSEWFLAHGQMSGVSNLMFVPDKHIELITASSNNQVIGRAIFCNFTDECLDGDTLVLTENGYVKIKDLNNVESRFATMNPETGVLEYSEPCFVRETTQSDEYYEIELEDGSIVKCTPTHRFLLNDGTYKYAKDLTEYDELDSIGFNIGSMKMKIKHISHVVTPGIKEPYYDVVNCLPYNNFLVKTDTTNIVSHNCNFGITNDVEKLKKKQKQLISQIDARMKSRFMRERAFGTYLPTLNIIASSKNSEQSFLEDYIETKKKNESKTTLIVDEPQWVVDSRKDSPEKFYVAIGNRFLANELLPLNPPKDLIDEYRAKGYTMLEVPIGYRENFEDNIDGALTDIAGIATAASLKYISGVRWNEIKTARYENPFTKEIIEVGTAKDDNIQYYNFFDLSKVSDEMRAKPLYIHLDMSRKGDKTGIAGVYVLGKKPKIEGEDSSREMFYRVAFSVSVKAPKGYEISFDKNRIFIRWLREQGFNIKGISSDTFQSAQIQQQLISDGFDVKTVSVDRLDPQTKQCLPYAYLKSAIYDRRLEVYKECDFLTEEVLGLERESDGHIQHPEGGTVGSKDAIDAVCGALFNASQNSDEIGYSYGESLENMLDINSDGSDAKQLTVALEDELRNLGPVLQPPKNGDSGSGASEDGILNPTTDFGGPTDDYNPYDNILLW